MLFNSRIKVKIGEYNTNETQSCVPGSQLEECSEPTVEIAVEEIIRDGDTTNGPYNFVLLRLVDKITFTGSSYVYMSSSFLMFLFLDFIRPICLPLEPEKRPKDFKSLIFSGWGAAGFYDLLYDVFSLEMNCYRFKRYRKKEIAL